MAEFFSYRLSYLFIPRQTPDLIIFCQELSYKHKNFSEKKMPLTFKIVQQTLELNLSENFSGYDDEAEKSDLFNALPKSKKLLINARNLKDWDSTLVVILYNLAKQAGKQKIPYDYSSLPDNLRRLVSLALKVDRRPPSPPNQKSPWLETLGGWGINVCSGFVGGLKFLGRTMASTGRFLRGKAVMRPVDFWFAMEDCGYRAVAIVSLVSFMVGLILAFVGAIQLQTFGAQIYVASLVTIGMTRIMGAIMAGIIMAGRTGASYAAAIGTMQVNEEIDALKTMGIPVTDFLILPRTLSLILTMPVLTVLADFMGIFGGTFVGTVMLDISLQEYIKYSVDTFSMKNFLVGVFHGFLYGLIISLCGCYYGINSGRNADSVGKAATKAVVSAIVWMIVITGILTFIFKAMGI